MSTQDASLRSYSKLVIISDDFLKDLQERYQRETRPVCRVTHPDHPEYIGINKDTLMNCINDLNRTVRKQTYDALYTWCYGDAPK